MCHHVVCIIWRNGVVLLAACWFVCVCVKKDGICWKSFATTLTTLEEETKTMKNLLQRSGYEFIKLNIHFE